MDFTDYLNYDKFLWKPKYGYYYDTYETVEVKNGLEHEGYNINRYRKLQGNVYWFRHCKKLYQSISYIHKIKPFLTVKQNIHRIEHLDDYNCIIPMGKALRELEEFDEEDDNFNSNKKMYYIYVYKCDYNINDFLKKIRINVNEKNINYYKNLFKDIAILYKLLLRKNVIEKFDFNKKDYDFCDYSYDSDSDYSDNSDIDKIDLGFKEFEMDPDERTYMFYISKKGLCNDLHKEILDFEKNSYCLFEDEDDHLFLDVSNQESCELECLLYKYGFKKIN